MAQGMSERKVLLELRNVRKWYLVSHGLLSRSGDRVRAVDGVSLNIYDGETLGLVGESGCGKTTLGKIISGLERPTDGSVMFEGYDLFKLNQKASRILMREIQTIFQDPYDSLDPRMTIEAIIAEPLVVHGIGKRSSRQKRVLDLLDMTGIPSVYAKRYPHELSGGQRQRVSIARAIALTPKFIVCDEPVSSLDVSVQSQILNLLSDLRRDFNLTYLFIAHGLAVVKHISERIAVMYLGKIVEVANKHDIYQFPQHPYTKALISAIPVPDPKVQRKRIILEGGLPSPIRPPSGCRFHTRCSYVQEICREKEPTLLEIGANHLVACHLSTERDRVSS